MTTTQGEHAQPEALRGAPPSAYSQEDRAFYTFWYGYMLNELMQTPLAGVSHSTARYIWDAAIAHVAAQPAAPQADSQPALDEATAMNRTRELAESGRWPSDWVEAYRRGYSDRAARAIEAEVHKQDTELIRQMHDALCECAEDSQEQLDRMEAAKLRQYKPQAVAFQEATIDAAKRAITAARARLGEKT